MPKSWTSTRQFRADAGLKPPNQFKPAEYEHLHLAQQDLWRLARQPNRLKAKTRPNP